MANTYKSVTILRELGDTLKKMCAATLPVATDSFDSNGNPVLTLSADATPAAGERVVVIRVQPTEAAYAKDILGNAAIRFSPHQLEICTELGGSATDHAALTPVQLLPILIEAGRRGCRDVKWYQSANGDVPATSEMTDANLKQTWRDLYDSRKGQ